MSTHTKGPWRVTRHNGLPDAIMAPDEALGWVGVAKIVILNDHEANAALLAAAPDLLAGLKRVHAVLEATGDLPSMRADIAFEIAKVEKLGVSSDPGRPVPKHGSGP